MNLEKGIKLKNNFVLYLFIAFLSSVLLYFSYPPYGLWYFAFFAFIPLLLISEKRAFLGFFAGFLSGFFFFSISLYFLKYVAGFIYLLLALYLALYWGIFFSLIFSFDKKKIIFLGGCIYFFLEIIMANFLTGFPWLPLGLTQYNNFHILKIAKFTGIFGLSFILITFNLFLYTLIKRIFSFQQIFFIFFLLTLFFLTKIPERKILKGKLNILLLQPNFIPEKITSYENKEKILSLLKKYVSYKKVDIVILPEGVFEGNILKEKEFLEELKNFSKFKKCAILIGSFTGDDENLYNSSILINGDKIEIYNKIRLVPYGEFILGGKFKVIKNLYVKMAGYEPYLKSGKEYKIFEYKGIKFSTPICYENIFPNLIENFLNHGSDFFVVITNDSWFQNSIGPYQHFYHNIFRSVETGRYFLQAGLTGITGIVKPEGKIEKILEKNGKKLFFEGNLFHSLNVYIYKTFYSNFGIYPFFLFTIILTGVLLCKN